MVAALIDASFPSPFQSVGNATCATHGFRRLFVEDTCASLSLSRLRKNMTYMVSSSLPPYCSYSESIGGFVWNTWLTSSTECSTRFHCVCVQASYSSSLTPPPFPPTPTHLSPSSPPPLDCGGSATLDDSQLCSTCREALHYLYTNAIAIESYWPWLPEAWRNDSDTYWNGGCRTYTASRIAPHLANTECGDHLPQQVFSRPPIHDLAPHRNHTQGSCRTLYHEVRRSCECLLNTTSSSRLFSSPPPTSHEVFSHGVWVVMTNRTTISETTSPPLQTSIVILSLSCLFLLVLLVAASYSSPAGSSHKSDEEEGHTTSSSSSISPTKCSPSFLESKHLTQRASDPHLWSEA